MSLATSKLATKRLQEHHVDVILNNKVAEIGPDYVTLQSGEKLASDATILVSGIKRNNELHEEEVSFQTSHISQESENILTCGDVSEYGLYTTAHNAMLEGRRIGEIIADKIHGITPNYPELINWPFLMLALGPYD